VTLLVFLAVVMAVGLYGFMDQQSTVVLPDDGSSNGADDPAPSIDEETDPLKPSTPTCWLPTSLEVSKTAEGYWECSGEYNWTLTKEMSPAYGLLGTGEEIEVMVWLNASRELAGTADCEWGVRGTITIENTGDNPTMNIHAWDVIEKKIGGGNFVKYMVIDMNSSLPGEISAGDTVVLNYQFQMPYDADQEAQYRNVIYVSISNHPWDGYHVFLSRASFTLPESPTLVDVLDEEATVTDEMGEVPGFNVTGDDDGPWYLSDNSSISYTMTITNEDVLTGDCYIFSNNATLIENDTGDIRKADATVTICTVGQPPAEPAIEVTKTAECIAGIPVQEIMLGHGMVWNITVTNTGNVPLDGIWVNDTMLGISQQISLGVGESFTLKVNYTASQNDVGDDYICNTVEVEAYYGDIRISDSAQSCVFVANPEITVTKVAQNLTGSEIDEVFIGEEMIWNITVCNTGNVAIDDMWVNDTLTGLSTLVSLAPGECAYFDQSYTVDEEDMDEEDYVSNTVTVDFFYCHAWFSVNDSDRVFVAMPGLMLTKEALCAVALIPVDETTIGHGIIWRIVVTNTGNVDLTNITVSDPFMDMEEEISLAAGENITFDLAYTVEPADIEEDHICNHVYVNASYSGRAINLTEEYCVFVAQPSIDVTKSAWCVSGETPVQITETGLDHEIVYNITVCNTGNVPLDVWVNDTFLNVSEHLSLTPGECREIHVPYITNAEDMTGYWINNTVEVDYFYCHHWFNDSAQCGIFIGIPELEIVKEAYCLEYVDPVLITEITPGHEIVWRINITNVGNVPIGNVNLTDPMMNFSFILPVTLLPGQFCIVDIPYIVDTDDMDGQYFITNTAFIEWPYCHTSYYAEASYTIFVAMPDIEVEKRIVRWNGTAFADVDQVCIGDEIFWNITICNTGNVPLPDILVVDTVAGINESIALNPGECEYYHIPHTVTVESINSGDYYIRNQVNATYFYCHVLFGESDWDEVFVAMPGIEVEKIAMCYFGEQPVIIDEIGLDHEIVWNITVQNTGNVPLEIWVNDTFPDGGVLSELIYLTPGECMYFEYEFVTDEEYVGPGDLICNSVMAEYYFCGSWYSEEDQWCVFIANPCVNVQKIVMDWIGGELVPINQTVVGHEIIWRIVVWNACNVDLEGVWINDTLIGFSQQVDLAIGESVVLDIPYVVDVEDIDSEFNICNHVEVAMYYCHIWYYDSADACVYVLHPCLDIEKRAPDEVCWGNEIPWEITVTNCGNVPLERIKVSDPSVGLYDTICCLQPGESVTYYAYTFIPYGWCQNNYVFNTAFANVTVIEGHCEISVSDTAQVFIVKPDIDIEKTGPAMAIPGQNVTFLITVWNDGNVPLWNISVTDPYLELSWYIDYLAVGECAMFTAEFVVPGNWECDYFTNWAKVSAWYYGEEVTCFTTDADCHEIDIVNAAITLEKTGPVTGEPGTCIEYTFYINNTGEIELEVWLNDTIFGGPYYIGILQPGEGVVLTATLYIDEGIEGPVNNTATVTGLNQDVVVTDTDSWTVMIVQDDGQSEIP